MYCNSTVKNYMKIFDYGRARENKRNKHRSGSAHKSTKKTDSNKKKTTATTKDRNPQNENENEKKQLTFMQTEIGKQQMKLWCSNKGDDE